MNKELISKESVLKLAKEIYFPYTITDPTGSRRVYYRHRFIDPQEVERLPTIEERQTGKWIEHIYKSNYLDWHERTCSVCKLVFGYFTHWNYCPHCGAKMEGEEHDKG